MSKLTVEEYNLITTLTLRTHLDESFDLIYKEDIDEECWIDCETEEEKDLQWGFELLDECLAYPFQHEGFTDAEAEILTNCIRRFVPDFEPPRDFDSPS